MRIEDIGPNFAEDISEVERTILLQQLPALLRQRLRDETITGISVSKYPSSFRETRLLPGACLMIKIYKWGIHYS